MEKSLLLTLLISGLSGTSSTYSRSYYFMNESKPWLEAQSYCRAHYTDLATVDNMEDMKQLMNSIDPKFSGNLWTGLNKVPPRRWGWSSGEISQYMNWDNGEPNGGDRDGLCGAKFQYSGWVDADCNIAWDFVCYSKLSNTFIHVSTQLTWRSAQTYCRQHYTDLATIHNEEEHQYISDLLGSVPYAWIGLFFDNWKWSDQQNSTFRYWISGHPYSNTGNANCVNMVTGWNGQWDDTPCDAKFPFMCHKAKRKLCLVRLKITSGGRDLNDPALKTAILKVIEEKLTSQGAGNDTTLSWRVKNGKVFYLDKNMTMMNKDKCM